jgi:hypothetical protein
MFEEKILERLKVSQKGSKPDDERSQIMIKLQKHERLTSQEFEKVYETIWKDGPKMVYQKPEDWRKTGDTF